MITDYEEDEHFCLKCHTSIIGLENYVNHRKTGCSKNLEGPSKSPLPSHLLPPDESFNLKAVDFFSSLELRSSSKKTETQSTSGKNFSGILTRSKTTAVIQAASGANNKESNEPQQSKSGKNVWIGGHQLKELGHGDNQSKLIKAVDNLERRKEEPTRLDVYEESDEESEEYEYDVDDSSSDDQDIPPRNHTGGKWKPTSPIQWSRTSDRDWNVPPPTYTGGKWKRPTSPQNKGKWKTDNKEDYNIPPPTFTGSKWVASKRQDYQDVPPPTHTKGKWKPKMELDEDVPPPTYTKGKWKPKIQNEDDVPPPTYTKGKWKPKIEPDQEYPPPHHTKGKWKPKNYPEDTFNIGTQVKNKLKTRTDTEEDFPTPNRTKGKWKPKQEPDDDFPPPEHTKGKWKPNEMDSEPKETEIKTISSKDVKKKIEKWVPIEIKERIPDDISLLRKSSGTIQYWCSPCNRRLASKIVYERHLKSELHFKRTLQDREFDDGELNFLKDVRRTKIRPPEPIFSDQDKVLESNKQRKRKKIFMRCNVCGSKVNKYLIGKHLISHYHCRKGDITTALARNMVLENIHEIVLETPFQCSICKFYCNTHEYFLRHWLSEEHVNKKAPGLFFCLLCRYRTEHTNLMYDHLISPEHIEVVSVINRSVPIIIKKINPVSCLTCDKEFMLNIQLLKHCEKLNHEVSHVNKVKMEFVCESCGVGFLTNISLKRHKKKVHKENYYICTACNLKFDTVKDVIAHRRSTKHKYGVGKSNPEGSSVKKCKHCEETFNNFLLLKEHLSIKHPEHKIRCPHCGSSFSLSQELTTHLRLKQCKFEENLENGMRCEKCPFSSNSSSEMLFHVALHEEPLQIFSDGKLKTSIQYKCPICAKFFPKNSLLGHIRQHTDERPFVCKICGKSFARKNNLQYHVNNHEGKNKKIKTEEMSGERKFLCSTCGSSFKKKCILQQHMLVHTGKLCKCPEMNCVYSARTMSELEVHIRTHSEFRGFPCNLCDYKGKTKSQLLRHNVVHSGIKKYECNQCPFMGRNSTDIKRHIRTHTGVKPFNCPHCDYRSNTLENLRKHILSTSKHRGKSIYECKNCTFCTNFAKEFKAHLVLEHSDCFRDTNEASSYVAGIYEVHAENPYFAMYETEQSEERDLKQCIEEPNDPSQKLKTDADPIVCQVSNIPSTSKDQSLDQMLPMFIIPKEDCASDSWNLIGRYDVEEESGTLIPFHSDGESLFEEHF